MLYIKIQIKPILQSPAILFTMTEGKLRLVTGFYFHCIVHWLYSMFLPRSAILDAILVCTTLFQSSIQFNILQTKMNSLAYNMFCSTFIATSSQKFTHCHPTTSFKVQWHCVRNKQSSCLSMQVDQSSFLHVLSVVKMEIF